MNIMPKHLAFVPQPKHLAFVPQKIVQILS